MVRTPLPTKAERLYLALAGLVVIVSVFKAPRFPASDPALFEYFGRSLLHGGRLYAGDLIDNKLPSIYLVNALWQALFGSNYFLHTCAEAAINLGAVALFTLALRKAGVRAWPLGTFLFAVFFSLPFPYFDTVYHYAVFFIVLGICLAFYGRNVLAGISITAATTFCFPAALTCVPILMQRSPKGRIAFLAGFFGLAALVVVAMGVFLGPQVFAFLMDSWRTYELYGRGEGLLQTFSDLATTGLGAGIPAMLALLLLVVRRPTTDASRFALVWSACALAGFLIPPFLLGERFLLPATPALAMAIASYNPTLRDVTRRPIVALIALGLLFGTAVNTVRWAKIADVNGHYVQALGGWIRSSIGSGVGMYTFDYMPELPLASDAVMLPRGNNNGRLVVQPTADVLVFGPVKIPPQARQNLDLTLPNGSTELHFKPVCPRLARRFFMYLYVAPTRVAAFSCKDEPR